MNDVKKSMAEELSKVLTSSQELHQANINHALAKRDLRNLNLDSAKKSFSTLVELQETGNLLHKQTINIVGVKKDGSITTKNANDEKYNDIFTKVLNILISRRKVNFDNLRANAIEASEQSERLDIPIFKNVIKLDQLFINWPNDRMLIFCDEKSNSDKDILQTLIPYYKKFKKWSIIIGPEGGFSDKERDFIISNNKAISVSLGKRVLRSDTAITVSLLAINEILSNKS